MAVFPKKQLLLQALDIFYKENKESHFNVIFSIFRLKVKAYIDYSLFPQWIFR